MEPFSSFCSTSHLDVPLPPVPHNLSTSTLPLSPTSQSPSGLVVDLFQDNDDAGSVGDDVAERGDQNDLERQRTPSLEPFPSSSPASSKDIEETLVAASPFADPAEADRFGHYVSPESSQSRERAAAVSFRRSVATFASHSTRVSTSGDDRRRSNGTFGVRRASLDERDSSERESDDDDSPDNLIQQLASGTRPSVNPHMNLPDSSQSVFRSGVPQPHRQQRPLSPSRISVITYPSSNASSQSGSVLPTPVPQASNEMSMLDLGPDSSDEGEGNDSAYQTRESELIGNDEQARERGPSELSIVNEQTEESSLGHGTMEAVARHGREDSDPWETDHKEKKLDRMLGPGAHQASSTSYTFANVLASSTLLPVSSSPFDPPATVEPHLSFLHDSDSEADDQDLSSHLLATATASVNQNSSPRSRGWTAPMVLSPQSPSSTLLSPVASSPDRFFYHDRYCAFPTHDDHAPDYSSSITLRPEERAVLLRRRRKLEHLLGSTLNVDDIARFQTLPSGQPRRPRRASDPGSVFGERENDGRGYARRVRKDGREPEGLRRRVEKVGKIAPLKLLSSFTSGSAYGGLGDEGGLRSRASARPLLIRGLSSPTSPHEEDVLRQNHSARHSHSASAQLLQGYSTIPAHHLHPSLQQQLVENASTLTLLPSTISPSSPPVESSDSNLYVSQAEDEENAKRLRRHRLSKIHRTLGSNVPPEQLFAGEPGSGPWLESGSSTPTKLSGKLGESFLNFGEDKGSGGGWKEKIRIGKERMERASRSMSSGPIGGSSFSRSSEALWPPGAHSSFLSLGDDDDGKKSAGLRKGNVKRGSKLQSIFGDIPPPRLYQSSSLANPPNNPDHPYGNYQASSTSLTVDTYARSISNLERLIQTGESSALSPDFQPAGETLLSSPPPSHHPVLPKTPDLNLEERSFLFPPSPESPESPLESPAIGTSAPAANAARRRAAANKLSRFFGSSSTAFFEETIRSLEAGVKEERARGQLMQEEERGFLESLGELRRRVTSERRN